MAAKGLPSLSMRLKSRDSSCGFADSKTAVCKVKLIFHKMDTVNGRHVSLPQFGRLSVKISGFPRIDDR